MTDYIKAFQSRLKYRNEQQSTKNPDITVIADISRQTIISALNRLGYSNESINAQNNADIYTALVTELQRSEAEANGSTLTITHSEPLKSVLTSVEKDLEPESTSTVVTASYEKSSATSLTLTTQEKEQLIQSQAVNLGITLFATEVTEIASSIASEFQNRTELIQAIADHLLSYTKQLALKQQQILENSLNQSLTVLNQSGESVVTQIESFKNELKRGNTDFKSVKQSLTDLLSIS